MEGSYEGLGGRPAGDPVPLVRALEVVVGQEGVDVGLDLVGREVRVRAALDAEGRVEQRAGYVLGEVVGPPPSGPSSRGVRCPPHPGATR